LRVLFFGSGSPASVIALGALARAATITGVVVPKEGRGAAPLVAAARRSGFEIHNFGSLRIKDRPDLICVATFPSIIGPDILELAARGGINAHWSLLPRHRGPDPLFWTYLNDDRWTGVTIHWLDEAADTGPILLQRDIPLKRGRSIVDVYNELASIAADLFSSAISLIGGGTAPRIAQDESRATREGSRNATAWRIDAASWPAERVWHVVRGLTVGKAALLRDANGAPIDHGPARAFTVAKTDKPPGMIQRNGSGWRVYCVDGYVDVDFAPRTTLLRRILRRLRLR
jgi:methionyl-tRNA formyltransferase